MKRFVGCWLLMSAVTACSTVPSTDNCVCNPAPKDAKLESEALTLAQVEAESLQQVKINPKVPQVPMGAAHEAWEELRATFKPHDRFYRASFTNRNVAYGGYLIMRGPCLVTFWQTWIT
jgi:hypothetical protein